MAIKYFNVKNGLTAGPITLDANTGNASATNLSVTGISDLGAIANVNITGGVSGQAIITDGSGNLTFGNVSVAADPAPMPTYIPVGDAITISANYQGLFGYPITVDGTMIVDGILIDVDDSSGGNTTPGGYNSQLQYNNAGSLAGIATVTYDGTKLSLGNVANVKITGGSNGQVLSTDGAGNLSWTTAGAGGNGVPGGVDTQVQFNDASSFGGNAGFTFNKTTGIFTAPYLAGNGNGLSNIQGANVSGAVAYASIANSVSGSNVSGAVAYATTANTVAGSNVSGQVNYAATANSVAGANVTGAVSYATTANSIAGANVTGQVTYAATANSVALANVSGAGNIASININGNASQVLYGNGVFATATATYSNSNVATFLASYGSNTITTTGNVSVGNIIGNGQALSAIAGANVTGAVSYATTANSVAVANVSGIGNIATTNYNGNGSQVLAGNGAWVNSSGGGGTSAAAAVGYSLIFGG